MLNISQSTKERRHLVEEKQALAPSSRLLVLTKRANRFLLEFTVPETKAASAKKRSNHGL